MRPLPLLLAAAIVAAPAAAQTTGTGGTAMGTAGLVNGVTPTPQMGRPPSPLGTTTTLSERIDAAAGLDTRRAIINGTAGSLGPEAERVTGNTTPGTSSLETAGRPAGAPLGTGTTTTPLAPSPDPR